MDDGTSGLTHVMAPFVGLGAVVWLLLGKWVRLKQPGLGAWTLFFLVTGLSLRLFWVFGLPAFAAPDEEAHYQYLVTLVEGRSLPVLAESTAAGGTAYEYYQPPLYYLALVPGYLALSRWYPDDPAAVVCGLRLFSVLLWAMQLLVLSYFMKTHLKNRTVPIFLMAWFSFLPTFVGLSANLNNDNMVIFWGTIFWILLLRKGDLMRAILLGVVLGLAAYSKLTAVGLGAVVLAVFIQERSRLAEGGGHPGRNIMVTGGIALLMFIPWLWRNLSLYGSLTATGIANDRVQWESWHQGAQVVMLYFTETFFAASGQYYELVFWTPLAAMLILTMAAGLVISLQQGGSGLFFHAERGRIWLRAAAVGLFLQGVLIFQFGWMYGEAQGRFAYVFLVPCGMYVALFLEKILGLKHRLGLTVHGAGFLLACAMAFTAGSLKVWRF